MSRWRHLALDRGGRRFRLRDRIVCSAGLALGVFFLILSWGFIVPVESLIKERILGDLPDRLRVSKRSVSMGPLALGGSIEDQTIKELSELPLVEEVYRQAHFPDPCMLRAKYAGEGLVTDLVLEMADPSQVASEVAPGYQFQDPGDGKPIPAMVPRAILDLVNSGISVNTNLPHISESAIIGKNFDLYLGTSSFRRGQAVRVQCVIVGVSDQIGAGGPAIPYDAGLRLAKGKPLVHALTLKLSDPSQAQQLVNRLSGMGLAAPRQEMAGRVTSVAALLKFFASLLPLAVLSVTAVALTAILELQVSKERQIIALYRALGATKSQITTIYLMRAFTVAIISLVLGTAAAYLCGFGVSQYLAGRIPEEILRGATLFAPPVSSIGLAALFCFLLTTVAGWYPARKAALCDPAKVFREPA